MGRITAAAGSGDGGIVALGSHTGDVVVYDQQTGTRLIVPLGEKARGVSRSLRQVQRG